MKILTNLSKIDKATKAFDIRNSLCVEVGDLIFLGGFAGIDLATGKISEGPISKHANDSIDCYEYILKSIGLSLDNVIKVNAFLKNPEGDYVGWNEVFKVRFNAPYPCRTTVGAPLVAGCIELEFVAAKTTRSAAKIINPV
jgi:2-iminobutanoate/2-iminopropanoate deaminase